MAISRAVYTPRNLLPIIHRHSESLKQVCDDLEAMLLQGREIFAACAFSGLFPFLTQRQRLTPTNQRHHYDLMCRKIFTNIAREGNALGYKPILPLGTLGKLLNHYFTQRNTLSA